MSLHDIIKQVTTVHRTPLLNKVLCKDKLNGNMQKPCAFIPTHKLVGYICVEAPRLLLNKVIQCYSNKSGDVDRIQYILYIDK